MSSLDTTVSLTLHPSTIQFLESLNLPSSYPFPLPNTTEYALHPISPAVKKRRLLDYFKSSTTTTTTSSISGMATAAAAATATISSHSLGAADLDATMTSSSSSSLAGGVVGGGYDDITTVSSLWENLTVILPCLTAAIRLVTILLAPIVTITCLLYLMTSFIRRRRRRRLANGDKNDDRSNHPSSLITKMICLGGITSSAIMMMDDMYILEYSRLPLVGLFILTSLLSHSHLHPPSPPHHRTLLTTTLSITLLLLLSHLIVPRQPNALYSNAPSAGLYYSKSNARTRAIVAGWREETRVYDDGRGTRWAYSGDARTIVPFLANKLPDYPYTRRWLPISSPNETEALALDFAFPPSGRHDPTQPTYFILHGITGGSQDEFVKDFVYRQTHLNRTCVVMITRGLMNTPVTGDNLFHFADTTDVARSVDAVRRALPPGRLLIGVGFSMGGITLANYVATMGGRCRLNAAVAFSAGVHPDAQREFERSESLWAPFLVKTMKDKIMRHGRERIERKLTGEEMRKMEGVSRWVDLDRYYFVRQAGVDGLDDYYREMSAYEAIENVSIPLSVVTALDDPMAFWKIITEDPQEVAVRSGGNVMLLVTKTGGHVGWPLGWKPREQGYRWMSDVTTGFVESVERVVGMGLY